MTTKSLTLHSIIGFESELDDKSRGTVKGSKFKVTTDYSLCPPPPTHHTQPSHVLYTLLPSLI